MPIIFPSVAESLNVRIFSAGCVRADTWWTESDRLRGFWRLYRHESDGAGLKTDRGLIQMPAQRLVVVPAGLPFEPTLEHPVEQFFLQFEFVGWPAPESLEIIPDPVILPSDPKRDILVDQIRNEIESAESIEPVLASRMKSLVHHAAAEILGQISPESAQQFLRIAEGRRELVAVLQYIDAHIAEPMSNARLAEIALASESRFIRRFREATGRTPARYVQDRRVSHAAELLVSTDHTIDEIAGRCGFTNRYYFTRVFAQRMGCPPARYRSRRPFLHNPEGSSGAEAAPRRA
ncbi:MAG: AraC family transcriptional regulator [Myxococcota bacterium]|nr:AraC family transcriptional regulator [Myxococcota bacterium]